MNTRQPNTSAPPSVPEASAVSSNDETVTVAHTPVVESVEMPGFVRSVDAGNKPLNAAPGRIPTGKPEAEFSSPVGLGYFLILFGIGMTLLLCYLIAHQELEMNSFLKAAIFLFLTPIIVLKSLTILLFPVRVSISTSGVVVRSRFVVRFSCWEDITAVIEGADPSTPVDSFGCGFVRMDGTTFWWTTERIDRPRELAALLHNRIDPKVRAAAFRALEAGQIAWFGSIGLSRDGFHRGKSLLPWKQISSVGFDQRGRFEVLKRGSSWSWFSQPGRKVSNLSVLLDLYETRNEWLRNGGEMSRVCH